MKLARFLYKNFIWKGANLVSVFILNIVISRLFGAAAYGTLFYLVSIYAFILLLLSFSLESAISYYFARSSISGKLAFAIALAWTLICTLISYFVIQAFVNDSSNLFNQQDFLFVSLMFIAGNLLTSFFQTLCYTRHNYVAPNVVVLFGNLVLGFLAFAFFDLKDNASFVQYFSFAYLVSFFITGSLLAIIFFIKYVDRRDGFSFTTGKASQLLKYALVAFGANLVSFLIFRVSYWFVEKYGSAVDLGNYIQVNRLASFFFVVPGMIASVIFPFTVNNIHADISAKLQFISRCLIAVFLPLNVVLCVTGYILFPLVFGPSYTGMHLLYTLMAPGITAFCILIPFAAHYAGRNMVRVNTLSGAMALAFMILANIIFVPLYGVNAAAVICSITYMMHTFLVLRHFSKIDSVNFKDLIILKSGDLTFLKGLFADIKHRGRHE